MNKLTVIVPVYADWSSLDKCIESLKRYSDKKWRVVFVNDCGPDADLIEKNIKYAIIGRKNFLYKRNKNNIGFVKTCNRAVKYARFFDDILLLNSDAELTEGAIEEMQRVMSRDNKVASVSPRSNKATVFSIPFPPSTDRTPAESYDIFMKVKDQLPEVYETPTSHGFCMLIRRSAIRKIGLFDEVFGVGYGEENDFCMRARQRGYTHAIANHSFVFHEGSKSFTLEVRNERAESNAEILRTRHPDYDELVGEYIRMNVTPEQELVARYIT